MTDYPFNNREFSDKVGDELHGIGFIVMPTSSGFQTDATAEVVFSISFGVLAGKVKA